MRFRAGLLCAGLAAAIAVATPVLAGSFDLAISATEVGPGDVVTLDVSGAAANTRVGLFASADPTPTTLGPFELGRCGSFQIDLEIKPRVVFRAGRTSPDGTASFEFEVPRRLPPHIDGATVYFQAATVAFEFDPMTRECVATACTSNVVSATVVIP